MAWRVTSSQGWRAVSVVAGALLAMASLPAQAGFKNVASHPVPEPIRAPAPVDVSGITTVEFGLAGRKLGVYRQTSPTQWTETNTAADTTIRMVEVNRRDESIYLLDSSRGVQLQLDLRARKVFFVNSESGARSLYTIVSASNEPIAAPVELAPPVKPVVVAAAAPVVVPPPAPVQDAVNGGNVTGLEIGQSGRKVGEYRQMGPKAWVETTPAGEVRFRFDEVQRDDGAVYLIDKARGVQLQLDLHQRKVLYSQDGAARGALYDILSANAMAVLPLTAPVPVAAAPKDLAQQCREAVQGKVAWNRQGSTSWAVGNLERLCQGTRDPAATIACFQAEIRAHDQWPEALKICSGPLGGRVSSSPDPVQAVGNARSVVWVPFGQGGKRLGEYRLVAALKWVESTPNGQVRFRFDETARDEWSIYLIDRSRNVEVQLDLYRRKVLYGEGGAQRADLYDIVKP
jgi:hypothetical protein